MFDNIDRDTYNNIFTTNWNLKSESVKYCQQDCVTLHQILIKFNQLIFSKWSLNINNYPTLPSLAFGIFRSNFLEENTIPKFTGQMYYDIKKSFLGGHTDLYIPYGENLNHYDVNSLYPSVMTKYDMPVGPIKWFEGNILEEDKNAYGFFFCKIITPKNMNRPLLMTKVKTSSGFRTIAPLGTWNDWLFSEEMHNYKNYGYKFKVIKGYTFNKSNIFKDYVSQLYSIKQNTPKSDPMYLISKLLMNSLFGRFGMNFDLPNYKFIKEEDIKDFIQKDFIQVSDIITLDNGYNLIEFLSTKDKSLDDSNTIYNISISIASAITSYSRLEMAKWLADTNLNIWYMDTDSIITDSTLPSDNELGGLKLENQYKEAVFLAPKVYGGITTENFSFTIQLRVIRFELMISTWKVDAIPT